MLTRLLMMMGLAASGSFAEEARSGFSTLVSQDPLVRQILRRQLTQKNGGVTAAVRIATGQSVELQVVEIGPQPLDGVQKPPPKAAEPRGQGLSPAPGLLPRENPAPKKRPIKKASEQAKHLERQGEKQKWENGAKGGQEREAPLLLQ